MTRKYVGMCAVGVFTFFAFDPYFAAHELDKGLGHCQAQPATTVRLRHAGVCLRESLQKRAKKKGVSDSK